MRRLIHIPIVHGDLDLGISIPAVEFVLSTFWDEVEHEISVLNLDWVRVRIYQESLCDPKKSMNIINVMAREGSQNAMIILKLLQKGATLELKLEDSKIIEELVLDQEAILNARGFGDRAVAVYRREQASKRTWIAREAFIAKRIGETLKIGEVGILFIGADHNIAPKLPSDIQMNSLDGPFKRFLKKVTTDSKKANGSI
jgi:hypothetical protein